MKMVRVYKRKTTPINEEKLKLAIVLVKQGKISMKQAANYSKMSVTSLYRQCKNVANENKENIAVNNISILRPGHKSVFTETQEKNLMDYILKASDIYHGLSPKEVRKLAFEYSQQLQLSVPNNWINAQMAGEDWFQNHFMRRHSRLSVRKPQATSLARSTSFNRTTVTAFFTLLKSVYDRLKLVPRSIWNMDETGISTVQTPQRVVSRRGFKQIGRITSAERGPLVTLAIAISAQGDVLPPFFIFPRVHFKPHFLNNAPVGSDGAAYPSGWMTAEIFVQFLQHFQKNVNASANNPVLLLLDNHESHLSIEGLEFCKKHSITVLSLPPHTTHKLQPLDRSMFGPLKKAINNHCDFWITNHPGRTMTIYDIPIIIKSALPLAATSTNIQAGFRCTGISPLNPDVFEDIDFLPSQVTDRPNPNAANTNSYQSEETPQTSNYNYGEGTSNDNQDLTSDTSLQSIRLLPKAAARQESRRGRKRRSSEILTDCSIMNLLSLEQAERKKKSTKIEKKN